MKTILFILIASASSAQTIYSSSYWNLKHFESSVKQGTILDDFNFSQRNLTDEIKENKVKTITTTTQHKKSKSVNNATYNSQGLIVKRSMNGKKFWYNIEADYIHDTLLANAKIERKKTTAKIEVRYNDGNLTNYNLWQNGKLYLSHQLNYTDDNKLASHVYLLKKKSALLTNSYDNSELIDTKYFEKNKLIKHWTYTCDDAGEQVIKANAKESTSTCKYKEESNDGTFIVYNRDIKNGEVTLSKSYFAADSLFLKRETFKDDSILISTFIKDGNTNVHTTFRKGKKQYKSTWVYNENQQILSQKSYNFKKKTRVIPY